jgi:hypothetical protein
MVICDNIGNDRLFIRKFNIDIWKKMVENAVNSTLILEKKIVWKYKIRGKSTLIYEQKKKLLKLQKIQK